MEIDRSDGLLWLRSGRVNHMEVPEAHALFVSDKIGDIGFSRGDGVFRG
jgi:hypothetical protein